MCVRVQILFFRLLFHLLSLLESQNGLSWKGLSKVIWSNSPAANRDAHSSIRSSEPIQSAPECL